MRAGSADEGHDTRASARISGLEKAHGQRQRSSSGAQRPPIILDRPGIALQFLQDGLQSELDLFYKTGMSE